MINLNDTTELDDVSNLVQGKGFCIRAETLVRKWFQSTLNAFGNAAVKDTGTGSGNVAILATNGIMVRARWAASFPASVITGLLNIARLANISASKITSGTFSVTQIPSLNAATSFDAGQFANSQLPASPSTPSYALTMNGTVTRGSGSYVALGTYSASLSGNTITINIQTTGSGA